MEKETLEELFSGSLRPRRVYEKEWRASRCGRALTNIHNEKKVAFVTPNSVLITTDEGVRVGARKLGLMVWLTEEVSRKVLQKELETVPSTGLKRALRWAIGR